MQRGNRNAVAIAGRHRRQPAPFARPQRKGTLLEFDFGALVEFEAAEHCLHLFLAELVGDLRGDDAVSYTHLDVYKRQGQARGGQVAANRLDRSQHRHRIGDPMRAALRDGKAEQRVLHPVSYTHLDVYKRQHQRRNARAFQHMGDKRGHRRFAVGAGDADDAVRRQIGRGFGKQFDIAEDRHTGRAGMVGDGCLLYTSRCV